MNQKLKEKITEALASVLPITAIVLLLSVTIAPMPIGTLLMFLSGAAMLIVGVGFFSLGSDIAMTPLGEGVGGQLSRSRKVLLVLLAGLVIGTVVTIAEPDLQVLATQVPAIPDMTLILTVALGVGGFLALSQLRSRRGIRLAYALIVCYILVFAVSFFAPGDFIAVAFDSGGVTTGPITVPFIMALGVGLASQKKGKASQDDSFGLIAMCSVGPILMVLLLGIFYNPSTANYTPVSMPDVFTTKDVAAQFALGLPAYLEEVAIALAPILALLVLFQLVTRRYGRKEMIKMLVGFGYTYVGLVLFLTGVNVGFMPAGHFLGAELAGSAYRWLLIPIGMVIGYFIVEAEPAVHVLNRQVEEVTSGTIPQKAMQISLSVSVAVSLGLAMVRVLTGISIYWFLVPGYLLALGLSFVVPDIFTGIAFDSGGVASGPMTATFLLPFAMGACESVGGNILTDAFGIVAMVAMTPLITIQVLGVIYKKKTRAATRLAAAEILEFADEFVEYE